MVKKKIVNLSTYLSEIAVHGIQEKKGNDIVRLDLRNLNSSVSDYFIICSANSATQVKAIADFVEHALKEECNEVAFKQEGRQALQWVLIDYVNVVVHIMQPETRKFYRLEEMWSDASVLEHNDE